MTRADLAVQYAARGWAVFPLKPGSKQPATRSGLYAGTDDLVTIRRYWRNIDYNIGIWTGASNLVVIDLDIDKDDPASWRHGGDMPGIAWWIETCKVAEFDWESTYTVTTWSGGAHIYFASEKPYPPMTKKFGALVDVRAGASYVVAAGSEVNGSEFEHAGADEPAPLPEWLDALLDPLPIPYVSPGEQLRRDSSGSFQSAVDGLCRVLRESFEGERNNTLNWCVHKVGEHWWTEDQRQFAVDQLRDVALSHDLPERQTDDTIKSASRNWPAR